MAIAPKLRRLLAGWRHTPLHPQWLVFKDAQRQKQHIAQMIHGRLLDIGCGDKPLTPLHSPDLNLDEYLNAELKARLHAGEPVKDADHLKRKVLSHLRSIQKQPQKVKQYFQAKSICYAAA